MHRAWTGICAVALIAGLATAARAATLTHPVVVRDTTINRGSTGIVSIEYTAPDPSGQPNPALDKVSAFGFSLTFDPSLLTYVDAAPGTAVSNKGSPVSFIQNVSQQDLGNIGFAITLPGGEYLPPGVNQLLQVTFQAAAGTTTEVTPVVFGDVPLRKEVVNVNASKVTTATWTGGVVTLLGVGGAPKVTAVSPAQGPMAGGTPVTITGTGFQEGAGVTFGGTPAAGTPVFLNETTITCTTPPHAAGPVDVTVSNNAADSGTLPNGFTYLVAPSGIAVTPAHGPTAGGTPVTITGAGFQTAATVTFGGTRTPDTPAILNDTTIACMTPPHVAGLVDVTVYNTGQPAQTGSDAFEFWAAPTVANVHLDHGSIAGGDAVTVNGTGFKPGATVIFGTAEATVPVTLSQTAVTCTTPKGTPGPVTVTVCNSDGQSGSLSYAYTYDPGPTLTGITPAHGSAAGTTPVTITGANFQVGATVAFGAAVTSAAVADSSTLTCTAQSHAAGLVDVTVTNPDHQFAVLPNAFEYWDLPAVLSVTPNHDTTAGGKTVTLSGTGFKAGATVTFGGTLAGSPKVKSATTITCSTPAHAAGKVDVVVRNSDGQSGTWATKFEYWAAPTVTEVSPSHGPAMAETPVTVIGTGFKTGATVVFDSTQAATPVVVDETTLTCKTPAHAAGAVTVTVTNTDHQQGELPAAYTYDGTLVVLSVSPAHGPLAGGTAVTVSGSGFLSGAAVFFGGVAALSLDPVTTPTTITCTTPAHAAGVVSVMVSNTGGASNALDRAYEYLDPPSITGVTPDRGPEDGGTPVTLSGSGFNASFALSTPAAASVTFGGAAATEVVVVSDTQVTCVTPLHACGPVDVTFTSGATGLSGTGSRAYLYIGAPVFSVAPAAAPAPGVVNRPIRFTCGADDPNDPPQPVTVVWDFGDGGTATGADVSHTYLAGKVYAVAVTATNSSGLSHTQAVAPGLVVHSTFGQFTSDANTDILWLDSSAGNACVWEMDGTTRTAETFVEKEDPASWHMVGTGDFNGDGQADLVLSSPASNAIYIRLMDGTAPGALIPFGGADPSRYAVAGTGDYNGDGIADVLFRDLLTGSVYAWLTTGGPTPTVGSSSIVLLGGAPLAGYDIVAASGDFSQDGKTDIVWTDKGTTYRNAYVWLMDGTRVTNVLQIGGAAAEWQPVAAGDYDGDGRDDLLFRNAVTGEHVLWRMNGPTVSSAVQLEAKSDTNWKIAGPK